MLMNTTLTMLLNTELLPDQPLEPLKPPQLRLQQLSLKLHRLPKLPHLNWPWMLLHLTQKKSKRSNLHLTHACPTHSVALETPSPTCQTLTTWTLSSRQMVILCSRGTTIQHTMPTFSTMSQSLVTPKTQQTIKHLLVLQLD